MGRFVVFFFALGSLATPAHVAVEEHDWYHETGEGDPHESDHKPHPSRDHKVIAIRADVQPVLFSLQAAAIELRLPAPDVKTWVRTIEPEANGPPGAPESPPRPGRGPPL